MPPDEAQRVGGGRSRRAAKTIEKLGFEGDAGRWRALANTIHAEVCQKGYDSQRNTFIQRYDAPALGAALLRLPAVGFLLADDPRIVGTVEAIQQDLTRDGFVWRYSTDDGQRTDEGAFLVCCFWLADALILLGARTKRAKTSSDCCRCATIWACCRSNTTRPANGCWAIFRRRSRTSG